MLEKSAIIEIFIQLLPLLVFVICGFIKDFLPTSYIILQIHYAKSFKWGILHIRTLIIYQDIP